MTDPLRVLFREGRLPHPEGFYKVLEARVGADLTIGDRVLMKPRKSDKVDINCQYDLTPDATLAIHHLATQTYPFSLSPTVDVFERLVTPGSGELLRKTLDEAGITDLQQRRLSRRALEDLVIPTHEVQGHIEPSLSPDECFWDAQLIWHFLMDCVLSPTRELFLESCDHWGDDILIQSCFVVSAHEVYALIRDEQAWDRLQDKTEESDGTLSNLKKHIRTKQNPTAVRILQFLAEKSGGDIAAVRKLIDESYLDTNASLSFALPHLVRDLNRGIEIDRIQDFNREQTLAKWKGQYSAEAIENTIRDQQEAQRKLARNPVTRGLLSTYISLRCEESVLSLEVYSAENSNHATNAIPFIATLQEARRILQDRGIEVVASPVSSMESVLGRRLELLANERDDEEMHRFDVMKDLGKFYDRWKPAIAEARRRIFT